MARPRKQGERRPNGKLKRVVVVDERMVAAKYRIRDFGVSVRECTNPLAGDLVGVLLLNHMIHRDHWVAFRNYLRIAPPGVRALPLGERVQTSPRHEVGWLSPRYRQLALWMGPRRMNILRALADNRMIVPLPDIRATLEMLPH